MSEENRQQQSSAESTVAGAAKTGKAIASIAKGAATGGAHGAAVEAAKSSRKWTIPIVAVILLPVLIIAMLPSVIFGSLFGDGTDTPNGISDDTVLVQNLADINSGISMILSEGLNDVLARIDSDFAASGCDSKEVNNPFGSDVVFNANAIVSQYCAYKDTDATSISKDDMESLLAANKDKLYSFTYTDEVREVPSEPEAESTETVATECNAGLRRVAEEFTDAGIGLCLDDFGSGYANLNTVMRLPFSVIKVDRSLLFDICRDEKRAIFYESVVETFHKMNYHIVSEGVETQEEMEQISSWGVDMIQGYYFSRPLPEKELLELLKKQDNIER